LHFERLVARSERAHLAPLAVLGLLRYAVPHGVGRDSIFLDALKVACLAPPALDRPARAAQEHGVHPTAADVRRNLPEQGIGERQNRLRFGQIYQPHTETVTGPIIRHYDLGQIQVRSVWSNGMGRRTRMTRD
jgi:hypothetical protein